MSGIIKGVYYTTVATVFDGYTDLFQVIVNLAEGDLRDWKVASQQYNLLFSFDLGLSPPMVLVASCCRHPKIRRKAVSLILQPPFYQGIWCDRHTGLCAQRIVQIEEEDLVDRNGSIHVPENRRIRKASVDLQWESDQVGMRYIRAPFTVNSLIYTTIVMLNH